MIVRQKRMDRSDIDKYLGCWSSASGWRLIIEKRTASTARVSLAGPDGEAIRRPYMNHAPTIDLPADYDPSEGFLEVELWMTGGHFTLSLLHEFDYELDPARRESLVPSLVRNEEDRFLDEFYPLFGRLEHFAKEAQPVDTRSAGKASLPAAESGACRS